MVLESVNPDEAGAAAGADRVDAAGDSTGKLPTASRAASTFAGISRSRQSWMVGERGDPPRQMPAGAMPVTRTTWGSNSARFVDTSNVAISPGGITIDPLRSPFSHAERVCEK
jgi:hypothetical protein